MLQIGIDLSEVIQEFYLISDEVEGLKSRILDRITDEYMFQWENNINDSLDSTRNEYKKAMYVNRVDDSNTIIGLTPRESQLALMMEEGVSPYDLKDGFSKSSKKKDKEGGGWYLTIPFRHATSEAVAEASFFSNQMPKQIEDIVKVKPMSGGKTTGLTLDELPAEYQKLLSNPTTGYEHKAPINQGLQRINMPSSDKEKRSGYLTFRRVSDNSDPDSWVHRGFSALKLMEKTMQQVDERTDKIIYEEIQNTLRNR